MVNAFGQVKCGCKIAQLVGREGDFADAVGFCVPLFQRDAGVKSVQGDVLTQRCIALVDKGDHGRVKFMLDGKHVADTNG